MLNYLKRLQMIYSFSWWPSCIILKCQDHTYFRKISVFSLSSHHNPKLLSMNRIKTMVWKKVQKDWCHIKNSSNSVPPNV